MSDDEVLLLFTTNDTLLGRAIRLLTFSEYSHVSLCFDRYTLGASARNGVHFESRKELLDKSTKHVFAVVKADPVRAQKFALDQIGKSYDWGALLAWFFRARWRSNEKWFCSELVAAALDYGGTSVVRKDLYRVTPQDLIQSPLLTLR